jgi:hypothetical protein
MPRVLVFAAGLSRMFNLHVHSACQGCMSMLHEHKRKNNDEKELINENEHTEEKEY